jgi:hypothetical protein
MNRRLRQLGEDAKKMFRSLHPTRDVFKKASEGEWVVVVAAVVVLGGAADANLQRAHRLAGLRQIMPQRLVRRWHSTL